MSTAQLFFSNKPFCTWRKESAACSLNLHSASAFLGKLRQAAWKTTADFQEYSSEHTHTKANPADWGWGHQEHWWGGVQLLKAPVPLGMPW